MWYTKFLDKDNILTKNFKYNYSEYTDIRETLFLPNIVNLDEL